MNIEERIDALSEQEAKALLLSMIKSEAKIQYNAYTKTKGENMPRFGIDDWEYHVFLLMTIGKWRADDGHKRED